MTDWLFKFSEWKEWMRSVFSALFLFVGVLLFSLLLVTALVLAAPVVAITLIAFASAILLLIFPGAPLALLGSKLGFRAWLWYDKFCNWLLLGSIKETISSRLGKSLYAGHSPVFFNIHQDRFISVLLHQIDPDHVRQSIMPHRGVLLSNEKYQEIMNRKLDDALNSLGVPI